MAEQEAPSNDAQEVTWEEVVGAIGRRFWRLAPPDFAEAHHADLAFGVTWQDLRAAVEDGIRDCLPEDDRG